MLIVDNNEALRDNLAECRQLQQSIALVPTMGNLHAGHMALVKKAQACCDVVVVSIFVNPLQFGAGEDFGTYPRTLGTDSLALCNLQTDYLYAPSSDQVYASTDPGRLLKRQATIHVPGLSELLCGEFRPGHFDGVSTVVAKLLNLVQPDVAVFGEKDFQQLVIIKRMVTDMSYPVKVIGVPTVREVDGLAMSSRNQFLTEHERAVASELYRTLQRTQERIDRGNINFAILEKLAVKELIDVGFKPDYVSIRTVSDLTEPAAAPGKRSDELVILAAAFLGKARLIDNLRLSVKV